MLGSIDCMHWEWKNCPVSWQGQYGRGDKKYPTIMLEDVASQDLWIWHAFYGMVGANNDINVLDNSPLFDDLLDDLAPVVPYVIVDKYVKDARALISSQDQSDIVSALNLLDAALNLSPKYEQAIELKARSLLYLRRYKQVADMLQDYIPSLRMSSDESSTSSSSSSSVSSDGNSQPLSRERVKLLSSGGSSPENEPSFKCFSVSDLKKKVMAGLSRNCDKEGQWR
ncbi:tetratricopeptide repeat-like superfamily protein [Tanacetum coccineum]